MNVEDIMRRERQREEKKKKEKWKCEESEANEWMNEGEWEGLRCLSDISWEREREKRG